MVSSVPLVSVCLRPTSAIRFFSLVIALRTSTAAVLMYYGEMQVTRSIWNGPNNRPEDLQGTYLSSSPKGSPQSRPIGAVSEMIWPFCFRFLTDLRFKQSNRSLI